MGERGRQRRTVTATTPAAFVRASTRLAPAPHVPEIRLHLADDAVGLWEKTEEEFGTSGLPPPFWAFPWAGGQALARHVLDHPELVRGRSVVDLASGSGLVAIAAAKAGAIAVSANDVDRFAGAAIPLNATANAVTVAVILEDILDGDGGDADVVLAGDVFYDKPMADRVLAFFMRAQARGARVLVGDPGRAHLPRKRFTAVATYDVPVIYALEGVDVKPTTIWQLAQCDTR